MTTRRNIFLALALAAALQACTREPQNPQPVDQKPTVEQQWSWATRADVANPPAHGDTYTMLSYATGITVLPNVTRNFGYYAYNGIAETGIGNDYRGAVGTLVPVLPVMPNTSLDVQNTGWYTVAGLPDFTKTAAEAQHLYVGDYRTVMIHPAIPVRGIPGDIGLGERLPVILRGDKVYASYIDDANGDGTKGDEFTIDVTNNRELHEVPSGLSLFPVEASIRFFFFSARWDGVSSTVAEDASLALSSLTLGDVGSSGWYDAVKGIVYPNYNYRKAWDGTDYRYSYSTNDAFDTTYPDRNVPSSINLLDPADPVETPVFVDYTAGAPADRIEMPYAPDPSGGTPTMFPTPVYAKYSVEVPVFPSDYSGAEPLVKPMLLNATLSMANGMLTNNASAPIAIRIERGKRYNFYVNSTSEAIIINYSVQSDWEPGDMGSGTIGDDPLSHLVTIALGGGGWEPGDMGDDEIE